MNPSQSIKDRALRLGGQVVLVLAAMLASHGVLAATPNPLNGQTLYNTSNFVPGNTCKGCHTVVSATGAVRTASDAFRVYGGQTVQGATATAGPNLTLLVNMFGNATWSGGDMYGYRTMPQQDKDDMAAYLDAVYWGKPIVAPSTACTAQSHTWTVGASTCNASSVATASGLASALTDATAPTTGAATYACSNGTWSQLATPAPSCVTATPAACTGQNLSWSVGGNTCNAAAVTTASGSAAALSDITGTTGAATFSCTNGTWGAATSATCAAAPPASCAAGTLSWAVGANACSAAVSLTNSGTSAVLQDVTAPTTGAATYACTNGVWGAATSASCSTPPANCAAGTLNWSVGVNSCSATAASTVSGAAAVLTNTSGSNTGAATYSCTNGTWGAATSVSCAAPAPASCAAGTLNWAVGANACSAAVTLTNSGSSAVLQDVTAPTTGSATYACTNGVWGAATSASCAPPPPANCASNTFSWSVGANTCSATAGATASGASAALLNSTGSNTGGATYACSNGTWGAATAVTCAAPQPSNCAAGTLNWSVGANSCSATAGATVSGATAVLSNSSGSNTGSASYACTNGVWGAATSTTCAPPPPANCAAGTLNWSVGSNTCSAAAAATVSGAAAVLTNSSGSNTGAATYACSNGTWGAATSATCAPPPPANCAAGTLNWSVGSNTCSASAAATASGALAALTNTSGANTGAATYTCTNGTWGAATAVSCTAPPANCAAGTLNWSVGSNTCSAAAAATVSGAAAVLTNSSGSNTGAATYACSNGAWGAATSATCAPPPPANCAAGTLNWSVGSNTCSASAAATASGALAALTNTSGANTGAATYTCTNGTWGAATAVSCTAPPANCAAGTLNWSVGSNTCSASAAATASGAAAVLANTSGSNTGAATYACSNGSWGAATNPSCAAPLPVSCSAQTFNWNVGGNSCSATAGLTASGVTAVLTNSSGVNTGGASYVCTNGTWGQASSATCTAPAPVVADCAATALSWTVGTSTCNASVAAAASGVLAALSDTTAPTTGVANSLCTNGVWGAPASATCSTAASGPRGISTLNGEALWAATIGSNGSSCADCHGYPKPDVVGNMSKINNAAGLASNQGVPSSIRLGIQNERGMNEFSAMTDADVADIAAYVNAVMYAKPLTDGTGAATARPFVVWQNSSKIDIIAMPTILYGSAPTVRTTLLLQAPADGPLHVETMTINNPLFTLNRVAVAAIAGVQKVDTVALAGADNAACPVGAFDLLAGQACGVELVLAVNSPGIISAKLQITTVAGQSPIDLPIEATITAQAVGGAGGGGCTMRSTPSLFDPMLLLLSLLAFGVLGLRRKTKSTY